MEDLKLTKELKYLSGYYGVLQTSHALSLVRAGLVMLRSGQLVFPAPPPPGGWPATSLPFLLALGVVDSLAIALGLMYVYRFFIKGEIAGILGIVSLTIALVSGAVYLIGTLPSGAWQVNLPAYLIVVLVFSPVVPLYIVLLKYIRR